jgi:hypothetical protein
MSASAAARGLLGIPLTDVVFRETKDGEDGLGQYGSKVRTQSIANILRYSGYTVTQLSTGTGRRYGRKSPYFIPPTFLYKLRSGVTPHICQIVALSESTGYRFVDWMRIFGFDLHQIPRLQVQLHSERTVLVTPIEFETASFRSRFLQSHSATIPQAGGGLSMGSRLGENPRSAAGRYFYAKIGRRDALVSRKLFPGMIVRVDRCYRQSIGGADGRSLQDLLWLLEQPGGLTCSHLRWIDDHQVVLLPSRPPWGSLPLYLSREARILGLVNLEPCSVRPESMRPETWQFRAAPTDLEYLLSSPFGRSKTTFSGLLRAARGRTGLTFRAARQLTGAIARILASPDYAIGLGLLSDYEAMDRVPRHITKIISLCITYCLDIRQLMEAAGVYIDDSGKMPLPVIDSLVASVPDFLDSAEQYRTIGLGAGYAGSPSGQL